MGIMMGRLIKFLIYLMVFSFIGLVLLAYMGPQFGMDFSPPSHVIVVPVELGTN